MANLITISTSRFRPEAERPNPINPIGGEGVLAWLRAGLISHGYGVTKPEPEDWGWYVDVTGAGGSYLVGASGEFDAAGPVVDWILQIHRRRTLTDKLMGRNKLDGNDALTSLTYQLLHGEPDFTNVAVEKER